jgi:hypothetical protein
VRGKGKSAAQLSDWRVMSGGWPRVQPSLKRPDRSRAAIRPRLGAGHTHPIEAVDSTPNRHVRLTVDR